MLRERTRFREIECKTGLLMRTARAKVVKGKIVTRTKFPEGTKLVLVVDEPKLQVVVDEEDEKAFDEAVTAIRAGKTVQLETFREIMRRL